MLFAGNTLVVARTAIFGIGPAAKDRKAYFILRFSGSSVYGLALNSSAGWETKQTVSEQFRSRQIFPVEDRKILNSDTDGTEKSICT